MGSGQLSLLARQIMYYKTFRTQCGWFIRLLLHMLNECMTLAVKNQWNGMVDWNGGMEYWNDLCPQNGAQSPLKIMSIKNNVEVVTENANF